MWARLQSSPTPTSTTSWWIASSRPWAAGGSRHSKGSRFRSTIRSPSSRRSSSMTEPGLTSELSPRRLKRLLKDYVRQLHLEPDNMVIRLKVAFVLKELGRPDEAIETYEAVARAFAEEG